MANIKFSAFTELAPIDQGINGSYIVGYEGDANTNNRWTFGEVAIGLKAVTATPYSIYARDGSIESDRDVTFSAYDLKFIATGNGKLWYQDGNQAAGKVLKSDANGLASWGAETDTGITGVTLAIGTGQTSPLAESITGRELTITSNKYGGTNQVGYVPEGGANTTFLRGDGTWVTPANIANTDLNLDASRTLGLGASKNLTFTGSGTSKVTFSNTGGVQFDEDVTFVKNTIIQGQAYTELNSLSNTLTVNWNDSNVQTISGLTGAYTFTPTSPKAGATYILSLVQTGAVTPNWNNLIKWAAPDSNAVPPTLSGAGKTDVITLICYNASGAGAYYGSITKDLS